MPEGSQLRRKSSLPGPYVEDTAGPGRKAGQQFVGKPGLRRAKPLHQRTQVNLFAVVFRPEAEVKVPGLEEVVVENVDRVKGAGLPSQRGEKLWKILYLHMILNENDLWTAAVPRGF
jgi:hypothetical protein